MGLNSLAPFKYPARREYLIIWRRARVWAYNFESTCVKYAGDGLDGRIA